jgi:hypothetical protein
MNGVAPAADGVVSDINVIGRHAHGRGAAVY